MKTYLEEKIEQFRFMANNENLSDEEIVKFIHELICEGYGDGHNAASIIDGFLSISKDQS